MASSYFLFVCAIVTAQGLRHRFSLNKTEEGSPRRHSKFLNLFSVVRFPNSGCSAHGGLNGTCYSEAECRKRQGLVAGGCAGGFGVCCLFHASCGQKIGENSTYLTTDTSSSSCQYTICRLHETITTLRLDFDTLELSPPFTCGGSSSSPTCTTTDGPLIGDCLYDTLTTTSPGSSAPPVICGYNTGQHMYIPASSLCNKVTVGLDFGFSYNRVWKIKVTQFDALSSSGRSSVPPPGCLQWYSTSSPVTISSFNYKYQEINMRVKVI